MAITKATASSIAPAAKGDLVAGSATNDAAVLGVGANNTVLTADSSEATGLKWATPTSGGMTLINTGGTTLTGGSVTISSIPATYQNLYLVVRNFRPFNDGEFMYLRLNGDSNNRYYSSPTNVDGETFTLSYLQTSSGNDNSVGTSLVVSTIWDYANTATWKMVTSFGLTVNASTTTSYNYRTSSGFYNQTGAIDSITIAQTGASFNAGTAFLYGVK